MADPYDLQRFVDAQAGVYETALAELAAGRKRSHWMWFVFPQLRGLGSSAMAWAFGVTGHEEATAYLAHPVLGPRLRDCTEVVLGIDGASAHAIFGSPDDLKFRSSLTLFDAAAGGEPLFRRALGQYFAGVGDAATLQRLAS